MIFPKPVAFVLGALLAVAEAVQLALHLGGYWHACLSMAVVLLGVMGVQALKPAQIAAKIPVHLAALATILIGGLEVLQNANLSMPIGVHIVIGVVIVIAATLGIHVSGFASSAAADRVRRRQGARQRV